MHSRLPILVPGGRGCQCSDDDAQWPATFRDDAGTAVDYQ
jgi:hypothetical protein